MHIDYEMCFIHCYRACFYILIFVSTYTSILVRGLCISPWHGGITLRSSVLLCTTGYIFYERNIVIVSMDIMFECCMLCCVRCDIRFISSSVHKCWIAVASVIVFVYGPVCMYAHSCHIKAAALDECRGALKDMLMTTVCEGWASPGLPPACPLDYFAISPHALAESLGDIRASISHTAAPALPPATMPLCFASCSHCK